MQTIDLFFFEGAKRKLLIEGVQQSRFQAALLLTPDWPPNHQFVSEFDPSEATLAEIDLPEHCVGFIAMQHHNIVL
ncbi:MAG TPA: hypothetical protein VLZ74_05160 [Methylocella sp.]|nr:hypothetical protein [Methylocella sp.]